MRDDDLSPEERAALAALAREAAPDARLEENTVRRLRAEGLLGGTSRRGFALTPAWAGLAVAAALALMVGSFALGRATGARAAGPERSADSPVAGAPADLQAAAAVQRAGTEYIAALAALRGAVAGPDTLAANQGREAAVATLLGAVNLVAEMVPEHPLAGDLILAMTRTGKSAAAGPGARSDRIWF